MKLIFRNLSVGVLSLLFTFQSYGQNICEDSQQDRQIKGTQVPIASISYHSRSKSDGKIIWQDGTHYEGEISQDQLHGKGRLTVPNQFQYQGDFEKDLPHGNGKIIYEDGSQYEGDWKNGRKDGFGAFKSSCHYEYLGNFKEGRMHGSGVIRLGERESFSGNWRAGVLDGKGIHYLEDGSRFEGNYREGQKHGMGFVAWENGDTLKAFWKNGVIEGESIFSFSDGSAIVHFWKDGKTDDKVTFIQPSGLKYAGSAASIAKLVIKTSLSNYPGIDDNFSLAYYSVAMEYRNQNDFKGATDQLLMAQFFQDPFEEDSRLTQMVNNELEKITAEREKIEVAKKEATEEENPK
ncbi:MAG: hypothetical protein AAF573_18100 [Bacteroidota bacterium]